MSVDRSAVVPASLEALREAFILERAVPGSLGESNKFEEHVLRVGKGAVRSSVPGIEDCQITNPSQTAGLVGNRHSVRPVLVRTASSANPYDILTSIREGEELLADTLGDYAKERAAHANTNVTLFNFQRVVDPAGNARGLLLKADPAPAGLTHNFGIVTAHFATRGIVSGSLRVWSETGEPSAAAIGANNQSMKIGYSQKNSVLETLNESVVGAMYTIMPTIGRPYLIDRCGDSPMSDWAMLQQIGGLGLAIAVSGSRRTSSFTEVMRRIGEFGNDKVTAARSMNEIKLAQRSGNFDPTTHARVSLEFQHMLAYEALEVLPEENEVDVAYRTIARELLDFCDQLDGVLKGEKGIETIADRAYWAAKLMHLQGNRYLRKPQTAIAEDMKSDCKVYEYGVESTEPRLIHEGVGHVLRRESTGPIPKFRQVIM